MVGMYEELSLSKEEYPISKIEKEIHILKSCRGYFVRTWIADLRVVSRPWHPDSDPSDQI